MAIRTQKTKLEFQTATTLIWMVIGNVKSFDGPGGKGSVIDITTLDSVAKEKLPGLPDEGQFSLLLNYFGGDVAQQHLFYHRTSGVVHQYRVTFTDLSVATFWAYVIETKISGKADSSVDLNVTLEITGLVTWDYTAVLVPTPHRQPAPPPPQVAA